MIEPETTSDLSSFIAAARPLVVGHVRKEIEAVGPQIDRIWQWLVPDDLLALAGLSRVEDAYTELLAWALCPPEQEGVALICQRAWLKALGIEETIQTPVHPQTQFSTDEGRPDLILDYQGDGFVVVVETKTGSDEHETPGGGMQSTTYPMLVRSALKLPSDFPVRMVFLTPSGTAADNPEAFNTTYSDFVVALASSLKLDSLPLYLRWNYSMLFTHLMGKAAPNGDAASGIRALKDMTNTGTPTSEAAVLELLSVIRPSLIALNGARRMTPAFAGFSETACLYAKNAQIVKESFRAFYDEVVQFCDALEEGIKILVPGIPLRVGKSKNTGEAGKCPRWRYLWLGDDGLSKHAHLRLDLWDELLITKNRLGLRAYTPRLSEQQLDRLWAIPTHEGLDFCELKRRKIYTFMKVKFGLPEDDPIPFAAERVVAVLKAIYAAEAGKPLP